MKQLTPTQAKKLIAFLIEDPLVKKSIKIEREPIRKIQSEVIYRIVKSTEKDCKEAWKKEAVALFGGHELL